MRLPASRSACFKQLIEEGVTTARINYGLGILSALNRRREKARTYFERARTCAERQGAAALLQQIDGALEKLA